MRAAITQAQPDSFLTYGDMNAAACCTHSGWAQRSPSGSPPLELVVSSLHHSEEIAFREQLDFMPHFYRHNKRKPTFNRTRGAAIGNATLTLPSLAHMPSEGARTSKCSQRCVRWRHTTTTRPRHVHTANAHECLTGDAGAGSTREAGALLSYLLDRLEPGGGSSLPAASAFLHIDTALHNVVWPRWLGRQDETHPTHTAAKMRHIRHTHPSASSLVLHSTRVSLSQLFEQPRPHLGRILAALWLHIGRTSAAPRPHLGRTSAAPRLHLGR